MVYRENQVRATMRIITTTVVISVLFFKLKKEKMLVCNSPAL